MPMLLRLSFRPLLICLLASAVLTACAGTTPAGRPSSPPAVTPPPQLQVTGDTSTPIPQATFTPEATMPSASPSPKALDDHPLVKQARQDLAQRLDVPIEDIELIQFEAVVWPDASLGCPRPGMVYAQVLSPGYLAILKVDDREYAYHAGKSGEPFYCENPTPPVPGAPGDI